MTKPSGFFKRDIPGSLGSLSQSLLSRQNASAGLGDAAPRRPSWLPPSPRVSGRPSPVWPSPGSGMAHGLSKAQLLHSPTAGTSDPPPLASSRHSALGVPWARLGGTVTPWPCRDKGSSQAQTVPTRRRLPAALSCRGPCREPWLCTAGAPWAPWVSESPHPQPQHPHVQKGHLQG